MSEELFFIPIITQALAQPDRSAALRAAIRRIESEGTQDEHRESYDQFRRFMRLVARHAGPPSSEEVGSIRMELAAVLLEEVALGVEEGRIEPPPSKQSEGGRWAKEHQETCSLARQFMTRPRQLELIVERGVERVATMLLDPRNVRTQGVPEAPSQVRRNIVAGHYRLRLETGRVLWEGNLTDDDLVWAKAFPRQPLRMAAATGRPAQKPSRVIQTLGGEIVLRVLPGIETGNLEIQFASRRTR